MSDIPPPFVCKECAAKAWTAVKDFILPRRVFIDILMSLHSFPVSGPTTSKTDFFLTWIFFIHLTQLLPYPITSRLIREVTLSTSFSDIFQLFS